MLVPVFNTATTNLPYVQQMDEFFQVKEVIPYLEYESYELLPADIQKTIVIGDRGIIAFRAPDNGIVCGDITEILSYIANNRDAIEIHKVLRSQLHRIEAADLNTSYEGWRSIAAEIFHDERQKKLWLESELSIFQKQRRIWAEIEPIKPDDHTGGESGIYGSISEHSIEYLIRWLTTRKNFVSRDWTKVWHYVNERAPFDERPSTIALSWIFAVGDSGVDFQQTRSILMVLFDRWENNFQLPDLGDFLSNTFSQDTSLLFDFFRPRALFAHLIDFIAAEGDKDDLFTIVDFSIDNLPKDTFALEVLSDALGVLESEVSATDKRRPKISEMRGTITNLLKVMWDE